MYYTYIHIYTYMYMCVCVYIYICTLCIKHTTFFTFPRTNFHHLGVDIEDMCSS